MLDWMALFDTRGIDYATSGPNVSRGNISTHCPFCGPADEGQHLSVSLDGKGWRCWRHPDHRGKSSARLLSALLGITIDDARVIAGERTDLPADLMGRLQTLIGPKVKAAAPRALVMPSEFKPFTAAGSAVRPFLRYLGSEDRGGYSAAEAERMSKRYDLRYCALGPYRYRIIFPVRSGGDLVGWTGRSVSPKATLRYRTLSPDPDKAQDEGYAPAPMAITNYLLWQDRLKLGGELLVLCEGPFDALRVDLLGREYGVRGTCLFTIAPSDAQLDLLHQLAPRFRRRAVLLDEGTTSQAMRVSQMLAGLGFAFVPLPPGIKDPGSAPRRSLTRLLIDTARGHR